MLRKTVVGALFDFAGFLTTLKVPFTCGGEYEASRMVRLLEEFAASRGLNLDDAGVKNWSKEVTSA